MSRDLMDGLICYTMRCIPNVALFCNGPGPRIQHNEPVMKTHIEVKSALVGLCVGIVAMLAIGASSSNPTHGGRYQFGATASHGMVIDTETGQVWSKFFSQNGGSSDADFARPKIVENK